MEFHVDVDREIKSLVVPKVEMSVVFFLADMFKWSFSDMGFLSLRILNVSMKVWYNFSRVALKSSI
jgi:hypothetical protein